ncbi:hypothetical protein [Halobacteriaceae bacterium SHR40]|uniref:hypothetical protein n=1 Tax=Halovenus amylolytica TaxID=2500550 RepID=UPI000FE354D3
MDISIFAEGSGTTRNETEVPFRDYYQGNFRPISSLADQLEKYGTVDIHIISDNYGLVRGDEMVESYLSSNRNDKLDDSSILNELYKGASSDVVVILLSTPTFNSLIMDNWSRIGEEAKSESLWTLGAARSSLESISFDMIRRKGCNVITYERVGVARISNKVREELLEAVKEASTS